MPSIDPPRYQRVINDLRERIAAGEFRSDDPEEDGKLPSTSALVDHYKFSRETIRQAITRMILLGELRGEQGAGVYIERRPSS